MIKTKSIRDPVDKEEGGDGLRLLIVRFSPKDYNDYDDNIETFAPSEPLLLRYKRGTGRHKTDCPCMSCERAWNCYEPQFREEMKHSKKAQALIHDFAERSNNGEVITLLCYCNANDKIKHCHRIIVKELIDKEASRLRLLGI